MPLPMAQKLVSALGQPGRRNCSCHDGQPQREHQRAKQNTVDLPTWSTGKPMLVGGRRAIGQFVVSHIDETTIAL
jgi:hypothetical protein